MNGLLLFFALVMLGAVMLVAPPDGGPAILVALPVAALAGWCIYKPGIDRQFLIRLFAAGLLARILVGTMIFVFHQQHMKLILRRYREY